MNDEQKGDSSVSTAESAAILEDPELSWEKKMRAMLELFNCYRKRQEDGEEG